VASPALSRMTGIALGVQADECGVLLNQACDRAVRKPRTTDIVMAVDGTEEGAAGDLGGLEPALARTGQVCSVEPNGMPTRQPRASWSVFVLRSVTARPWR